VRTFQDPDNPNVTVLVIDVVDMAAFQAFMESPETASAKMEDGVKDATLRVPAEVKSRPRPLPPTGSETSVDRPPPPGQVESATVLSSCS
jgi:hypothetical protein